MTTTPNEPVEDPQVVPSGDPSIDAPPDPQTTPDPEETVGPGAND